MHMPINAISAPPDSDWYVAAMKQLVGVVQKLSLAHSVDAVAAIVRDAARSLTGADGATFVLRDGNQCFYAEENAIAPLWKGKRFPMSACVSGWVMQHGQPTVIEDIYADARVPIDAYRPTFVKSLAMVPIRTTSPIGAIGNYWATPHRANDEQLALLQALADTTSVAIENAGLYSRLREQVQTLSEQEARIRDQHDSLEVFTRALAHDLKEPVRTMKSFSRMLLDATESADNPRQYLQFIRDAGDRMGVLVESVLRYMQFDEATAAPPEACPLQDVLAAARENLQSLVAERGAAIEHGEMPSAFANRAHLIQVFEHLIANSIRHNDRPVTVRISAREHEGKWLISVGDNGVGVPAEHAARIFLPFKRLTGQQEGAGLGLAICEKLIRRAGGEIWCDSHAASGALFCLTLPRVAEPPRATRPVTVASTGVMSPAASPPADALACLLVVDDRPDDLTLSKIMLQRRASLKCRMITASSGEEALEILRHEPVDLVLLDINMPGLDGFDVLEQVRENSATNRPAVIMCTGSDSAHDRERSAQLGAAGYLLKPPTFDALRPLLARIPTLRLISQASGSTLERAADTEE